MRRRRDNAADVFVIGSERMLDEEALDTPIAAEPTAFALAPPAFEPAESPLLREKLAGAQLAASARLAQVSRRALAFGALAVTGALLASAVAGGEDEEREQSPGALAARAAARAPASQSQAAGALRVSDARPSHPERDRSSQPDRRRERQRNSVPQATQAPEVASAPDPVAAAPLATAPGPVAPAPAPTPTPASSSPAPASGAEVRQEFGP